MKKLLLSLVGLTLGLTGFVASAQSDGLTWNSAQSYFNNFNGGTTSTSYSTTAYTSGGWSVINAALFSGNNTNANNSPKFVFIDNSTSTIAPCLNGKTSAVGSLTSPTLSDGLGTLKLNYGYPFQESNGVKFIVTITQNGEVKATDTYTVASVDQNTAYTYEKEFNITGEFEIEIKNGSPSNNTGNKDRLCIWNVEWTNCSAAKDEPTLTFSTDVVNVEAYPLSSANFTTPTLTTDPTGLTITYASTNEKVATVSSEGAITLTGYGITTITATSTSTDQYNSGQASYNLVVSPGEITVSQALEILNADTSVEFDAIVSGYITRVTSTSVGSYGGLTYYIADSVDASSSEEIQVYYGLGLNGEPFTSPSDIVAGAQVKVKGSLLMYRGTTPEINSDSELVEYTAPSDSGDDNGDDNGDDEKEFEPLGDTYVTFNFNDLSSLTAIFDGDPISFDGTEDEYNLVGVTFTNDVISIYTDASSSANTKPRLFKSTAAADAGTWTYRFYQDSYITISCDEDYYITGILFDATNLNNTSISFSDNGEYTYNSTSADIWSAYKDANATSVEITKTASGNNPVISTITVYYQPVADDGGDNGEGEDNGEGGEGEDGPTTAIDSIGADTTEAIFFNLQGIRVANPVKGQIYIVNGKKVVF